MVRERGERDTIDYEPVFGRHRPRRGECDDAYPKPEARFGSRVQGAWCRLWDFGVGLWELGVGE